MESKYTEWALYGSKNVFARTDTVFLPISEVCDGKVSLIFFMKNVVVYSSLILQAYHAHSKKNENIKIDKTQKLFIKN